MSLSFSCIWNIFHMWHLRSGRVKDVSLFQADLGLFNWGELNNRLSFWGCLYFVLGRLYRSWKIQIGLHLASGRRWGVFVWRHSTSCEQEISVWYDEFWVYGSKWRGRKDYEGRQPYVLLCRWFLYRATSIPVSLATLTHKGPPSHSRVRADKEEGVYTFHTNKLYWA